MATAKERVGSQRFNGKRGSRQYWIEATGGGAETDAGNARAALLAGAPTTWTVDSKTLNRVDDDCEVFEIDDAFYGVAVYRSQELSGGAGAGDSSESFEIAGQTQHIIAAKSTINAYAAAGHAAAVTDNGNLIGVTDQGVEGVDIIVPVYSFSKTKIFTNAQVTSAYKTTLAGLVGTVNNASFEGHAAGEVLSLGVQGAKRSDGNWELTFKFGVSKNATGLVVGDINAIAKKGWEYMWVREIEKVANNRLTRQPIAVYIEKVYDDGDFTGFNL